MYAIPHQIQLSFNQGKGIQILAKIIKPYIGYNLKGETYLNILVTLQENSNNEYNYLRIKECITNRMPQHPSLIELSKLRSVVGAKFNSNLPPILGIPLSGQCFEVIIPLSYTVPGGLDVQLDLDIAIMPYFKQFVCISGSKTDDRKKIGYRLSSQGYRVDVRAFTITTLLVIADVLIWIVYASLTNRNTTLLPELIQPVLYLWLHCSKEYRCIA
jgi:hypothetical protein